MAVNFFNRVTVTGPPARVLDFRTRAERTFERSVGDVSWTEHHLAEERMSADALGSWQRRGSKPRRLDWRHGEVFVRLEDERLIGLASLAFGLALAKERPAAKASAKRPGARGHRRRTGWPSRERA
jgi:hypothetical protein